MIIVDIENFDDNGDDIYSVYRGSRVTAYLDGKELKHCVYCNTTKGFAVCHKRDLSGMVVIADGSVIHELVFGLITVEQLDKKV